MEHIEKNKIHTELCDEKQSGISNMDVVITADNAVSDERSRKARVRVLYECQYDEYEKCVFLELPGVGRVFAFDDSYYLYDSLPQDVVAELAIYDAWPSCFLCGKEMIDNDGWTYVEIETGFVRTRWSRRKEDALRIQEDVIQVKGSLHMKVVDGCNDIKQIESISLETAANKYARVKVIDYECAESFETEWGGYEDSPNRVCLSSPIGDGTVRLMSWMWSRDSLYTYSLQENINDNKEVGMNVSIICDNIRQISLDDFMEYVTAIDSCEPLKVGVLKMENGKLYLEGIFSTCSVSLTGEPNLQWIETMVDELVYIDGDLDVDFENVALC